jgi:hypothetical protein
MNNLDNDIRDFEAAHTTKDKVDKLGKIVCNHILHRVMWQDTKMNFVLTFLALILALVAILVIR